MRGTLDTPKAGLMSRSLDDIFFRLSQNDKYNYQVKLAYLQIYKENIQDLIDPLAGNLRIRECPERGVFVEGLTWLEVSNTLECMKIL